MHCAVGWAARWASVSWGSAVWVARTRQGFQQCTLGSSHLGRAPSIACTWRWALGSADWAACAWQRAVGSAHWKGRTVLCMLGHLALGTHQHVQHSTPWAALAAASTRRAACMRTGGLPWSGRSGQAAGAHAEKVPRVELAGWRAAGLLAIGRGRPPACTGAARECGTCRAAHNRHCTHVKLSRMPPMREVGG
jgi:hypothetical protein